MTDLVISPGDLSSCKLRLLRIRIFPGPWIISSNSYCLNILTPCLLAWYCAVYWRTLEFEILVISSILWNHREKDKHWDWKLRDRSVQKTTSIWVLRAMPLGHMNWHQQSTSVLYPGFVDIVNLYIEEIWIGYKKEKNFDTLIMISSKRHFWIQRRIFQTLFQTPQVVVQ